LLKITKLDTLDLLSADVPRMAAFYHDVLGLPFYEPWDGDETLVSFDLHNIVICIMHTTATAPVPKHSMEFSTDPQGFDSIALKVDDLDDAIAAIDGKVEWINAEPFEMRRDNGIYFRNRAFRDPDGNLIYIQESNAVRP
jgi:glyoxylase I family protein